MFLTNPMKIRASWLWPALLVALVAGALVFAACGGEDPTSTPEPTATPAPTATPVPAPTSEPAPDSSMMSISDIDADSTVGDLIGALSEEETACIEMVFGEVILESMKDQPLSAVADSFSVFPIDCLSQENAITATVVMMSVQAGGLSPQTQECMANVFREDPSLIASEEMSSLELFACFTPEEAEALTPPDDGPAPDPAAIACLMEQLSGDPSGEKIIALLSGQDPSGQGLTMEESAMLGQAVQACGIETEFAFPDAMGEGDDSASGFGPNECSVGQKLDPGDTCSYGEFSIRIRQDGAAVLDGNIGGISMGNTVMDSQGIALNQFRATRSGSTWTIEALP